MKPADQIKVIVLSFLSIVVMVGVITLVSMQTTKMVASHGAGHGEEHGATTTEHHETTTEEHASTEATHAEENAAPADSHAAPEETHAEESAAPAEAHASEEATHTEEKAVKTVSGDAEAGKAVFMNAANMCMTCHAVDGVDGAIGAIGPKLNGLGERAATRVAGQDAITYIKTSIEEPNAYVVENYAPAMPALRANMSDDDFNNLVAFLASL